MRKYRLDTGKESYEILIGENIYADASLYEPVLGQSRVCVVTDTTVGPLYGEKLRDALESRGRKVVCYEIPAGEEYKNLATVGELTGFLLDSGFHRNDCLIALGGGVIGDLSGFTASVYQRGIRYVQVPTTLLAMTDSSVGGKTGVNHAKGKNMIGTFHQPSAVIADITVLNTLEERDISSGLAEVVKYGLVNDAGFFSFLKDNAEQISLGPEAEIYGEIIHTSCRIKAQIVEADEKEKGLRKILNLGHTFGHAMEKISGYGTYRHGEAVAAGTVMAAEFAAEKGICDGSLVAETAALYDRMKIFRDIPPASFRAEDFCSLLFGDKKAEGDDAVFVLPVKPGTVVEYRTGNKEEVLGFLRKRGMK